jgi:predicted nucleic acid-binding protein
LYDSYDVTIWWSTPVEIESAISRVLRMRQLDATGGAKARQLAADLAGSWSVMQPSDALLRRAIQFVARYELRAGDSLQLAAAWEWSEGLPAGKVFFTHDLRLREAARLIGFDVR